MAKRWIATAEKLPRDGEAVSFLIERHSVWMSGTYRCGFFESHWGTYDAGTVKRWSPLKQGEPILPAQSRIA